MDAPTLLEIRTAIAKNVQDSNCHGFSLFASGVRSVDMPVNALSANHQYFSKLPTRQEPQAGYLLAWETYDPEAEPVNGKRIAIPHSGIVVIANPLLLTHRLCSRGPIVEYQPVIAMENLHRYTQKFYVPRNLE